MRFFVFLQNVRHVVLTFVQLLCNKVIKFITFQIKFTQTFEIVSPDGHELKKR